MENLVEIGYESVINMPKWRKPTFVNDAPSVVNDLTSMVKSDKMDSFVIIPYE